MGAMAVCAGGLDGEQQLAVVHHLPGAPEQRALTTVLCGNWKIAYPKITTARCANYHPFVRKCNTLTLALTPRQIPRRTEIYQR